MFFRKPTNWVTSSREVPGPTWNWPSSAYMTAIANRPRGE